MVRILADHARELACPARMSEQCGHNTPVGKLCMRPCIVIWCLLTSVRYINALEERVAFLEARLPDHAEDHYDPGAEASVSQPFVEPEEGSVLPYPRHEVSAHSQRGSISEEHDERTSLVDGVAYLSLCASGTTDTTHEPYYVGSSSGATIARVIQSSIFRNSGGGAAKRPTVTQDCQSPETSRPTASINSDEPLYEFPDPEQALMLFDVFFERIHTRWPLLDRVVYATIFEKQYIHGSLTITERSTLHLIYVITARFLSLTRKPCGVDYEVSMIEANHRVDN
jgi:hypothetical protein